MPNIRQSQNRYRGCIHRSPVPMTMVVLVAAPFLRHRKSFQVNCMYMPCCCWFLSSGKASWNSKGGSTCLLGKRTWVRWFFLGFAEKTPGKITKSLNKSRKVYDVSIPQEAPTTKATIESCQVAFAWAAWQARSVKVPKYLSFEVGPFKVVFCEIFFSSFWVQHLIPHALSWVNSTFNPKECHIWDGTFKHIRYLTNRLQTHRVLQMGR